MSSMTPMLKQYMQIKHEYEDCILFFRLGDFYEMFFEDAEIASRLLGITLTSRGTHQGKKIPMCGIPYHSAKTYIGRLLKNGWKVAICEQLTDPKETKGIVERDVVRVITPGSMADDVDIDGKESLYMAALSGEENEWGLAHIELSTGEFRVTELRNWQSVLDELSRIDPAELIIPEKNKELTRYELNTYRIEILSAHEFEKQKAMELLKEQLDVDSIDRTPVGGMNQGLVSAGALIYYLKKTQKLLPGHIKEITPYHIEQFMTLDDATINNLELFRTIRGDTGTGTLFKILDRTITPMGGRLLRRWMAYPLIDIKTIRTRQSAIQELWENPPLLEEISEHLKGIYDMERLNSRITMGRANPKDLVALRNSLQKLPPLKTILSSTETPLLRELSGRIDLLQDIKELIERAIIDDPPSSTKEGGFIKEGFNNELDELIHISRDGKRWIARLETEERERTGIPNLRVGYNRVFGYYIEVTKSYLDLVPEDYIRKQTLTSGERFINQRLKEYEEKVLGAEEKRVKIENKIFEEIILKISKENQRIRKTAGAVGTVDVLCGLAKVALENNYTCPEINEGMAIELVDARHPVIENTVRDEEFVPNDIYLDDTSQQMLIITGPNMAGKSTILRQTALIVLMAQMGSFIPASRGSIGIVDRIFTRIGARDDISRGQSTFMVEMTETANILRNVTPRSLVILDEVGRGTSTYDGLSIAWAVAEALHDFQGRGVRTLFATHYHELIGLAQHKHRVKNFNIAVKEWKGQVIFLRKMVPGGTSRSYGIHVAKIAGIPDGIIKRAEEILTELEKRGERDMEELESRAVLKNGRKRPYQMNLFSAKDEKLRKMISELDIDSLTPVQALVELEKIKKHIEST